MKHVHTCENDRGIPGSGHVEWNSVFAALRDIKYDGWLTIESFGFAIGEISAAAAIWRDLAVVTGRDRVGRRQVPEAEYGLGGRALKNLALASRFIDNPSLGGSILSVERYSRVVIKKDSEPPPPLCRRPRP